MPTSGRIASESEATVIAKTPMSAPITPCVTARPSTTKANSPPGDISAEASSAAGRPMPKARITG